MMTETRSNMVGYAAEPAALEALAACWPEFSRRELLRLRFEMYCRQVGYHRPPAAVSAATDALCATLLAEVKVPKRVVPQPRPLMGVPSLWAEWVERKRAVCRACAA
jgi:hypothetical protein